MSFGYGVGEAIGAARLAWILYHDCYLVAREAPEEFRNLVSELASLQGILRSLRDEINSDSTYLEKVGEDRKDAIERTVDTTFQTLKGLQQLVHRFRNLGLSEGTNFWKRIQWATQQRDIETFRQKLMVHGTTLNLCMTSIGNSTLMRFERRLTDALELSGAAGVMPEKDVANIDVDSPAIPSDSPRQLPWPSVPSPPTSPSIGSPGPREGKRSSSVATGATGTNVSSGFGSPGPSPHSTPASSVAAPAQPRSHSVPNSHDKLISTLSQTSSHDTDLLIELETSGASNVQLLTAMDDAREILSTSRRRRWSTNQYGCSGIRTADKRYRVQVGRKLAQEFMEQAGEGRAIRPDGFITAKDWLRTATWWVMKSRMIVALDAERAPNESINSRFNSDLSIRQAHANLLKACWILYDVVLADELMASSLTDENRAMFLTLEKATIEDFDRFRSAAELDTCEADLLLQNLIIWEHLQPMEERMDSNLDHPFGLHPAPDSGRWITCDPRNAGAEDERVLFRCFVNAGVGLRQMRVETTSAPYLLVLWTKSGESEIKVTFSNQNGNLNLTRDFTPEDIKPLPEVSSEATGPPPVDLSFPGMPVTVYFLKLNDFQQFMAIPGRFFDAVRDREAKEHEIQIYRTVVETYEKRNPGSSGPLVPREVHSSCELRIYERVGEQGWDRTRRFVLTSSANEPNPWSTGYFLPLSRVQLNREDADTRSVVAKWSDCTHRTTDTHGTTVEHISYCYDPDIPNICVRLTFDSKTEVQKFLMAVLQMQADCAYTWPKASVDHNNRSSAFARRRLYTMTAKYRSLFVVNKIHSWQYGQLYHIPREIDFKIDDRRNHDPYAHKPQDNGLEFHILTVFCTDYVSNHVNRLDEPTSPPQYDHCENRISPLGAKLDFECLLDAQELLKAVTIKWTIKAMRSRVAITYKVPGLFRRQKETTGEISIWQRSLASSSEHSENSERRVLVRWSKPESDDKKWLTATVINSGMPSPLSSSATRAFSGNFAEREGPGSATALILVDNAIRGKRIDMVDMKAMGGKEKELYDLRIRFSSARDKEDFARDCGMML